MPYIFTSKDNLLMMKGYIEGLIAAYEDGEGIPCERIEALQGMVNDAIKNNMRKEGRS